MKRLLLFVLNFVVLNVFAQQPQLLQERNYLIKTTNSQIAASAVDGQGNTLYGGTTWINVSRYAPAFLMVRPNTDTVWTRKSQTILYNPNLAIQRLSGNNFITGGDIEINGSIAMSLQRINQSGFTLWARNYTSIPSSVNSILALPNKDLIIGGGYVKNFAFTRTDSTGNVKWSKGYPWGIFNDGLMDIKFTKTGNIIAAGITDKPFGPGHIKLMLVNQNGDSLKGKQLIVADPSRTETMTYSFSSVTALSDGGFFDYSSFGYSNCCCSRWFLYGNGGKS